MKLSVYVFGNLSSGYSQYPDDYTNEIFKSFYSNAKAKTQVAIHRREDIMYYSYIRKLEDNHYLGLCVLMNGIMLASVNTLFSTFENVFAGLVSKGHLVHFDEHGEIVSNVQYLWNSQHEINELTNALEALFEKIEHKPLPPLNYSVSKDSIKVFTVDDLDSSIVNASYVCGYTYIYKSKDYDVEMLQSYAGVIKKLDAEKKELNNDVIRLSSELSKAKNAQRNMKYVTILGFIVFVLVAILWNKVLFPSEVTKKDMGEYVYYGPMKNGLPSGVGVAIYHNNDKDKRLYYYGRFEQGKRIDKNAIMFYKDGSYFKGHMVEDKWDEGLFFDVDYSLFVGKFKDNKPSEGTWYEHEKVQDVK